MSSVLRAHGKDMQSQEVYKNVLHKFSSGNANQNINKRSSHSGESHTFQRRKTANAYMTCRKEIVINFC